MKISYNKVEPDAPVCHSPGIRQHRASLARRLTNRQGGDSYRLRKSETVPVGKHFNSRLSYPGQVCTDIHKLGFVVVEALGLNPLWFQEGTRTTKTEGTLLFTLVKAEETQTQKNKFKTSP